MTSTGAGAGAAASIVFGAAFFRGEAQDRENIIGAGGNAGPGEKATQDGEDHGAKTTILPASHKAILFPGIRHSRPLKEAGIGVFCEKRVSIKEKHTYFPALYQYIRLTRPFCF